MPIYAYRCPHCELDFDKLVRADTVVTCPRCGAADVAKQVALTAPQGKSKAIVARARTQAAKEGHFSHYSAAERAKAR